MRLEHEAYPHGVPNSFSWQRRPQVSMGCTPHSDYLPVWWPGDHAKFPGPWTGILNWFVAYRAADEYGNDINLSTNTGIRIGTMRLWLLSKTTMKWIEIGTAQSPTWSSSRFENTTIDLLAASPVVGKTFEGTLYLSPVERMTHGGTGRFAIPLAWNDIAAVLATTEHRLERINPNLPDDTAQAKFVVQSGVDYYPDLTTATADVGPHIPGAGVGRFLLATTQWRTSVMFAKADDISESAILAVGWPVK